MYCPKCNQQQASDEMRFCSRCGFSLAVVAHLLKHDGKLVLPGSEQKRKLKPSRTKIISESASLTLVSWAVAAVAMLVNNFGGALEIPAKIVAANFFLLGLIGLIRFIYGFIFVEDSEQNPDEFWERLIQEQARPALPPQQSVPIDFHAPATPEDGLKKASPATSCSMVAR